MGVVGVDDDDGRERRVEAEAGADPTVGAAEVEALDGGVFEVEEAEEVERGDGVPFSLSWATKAAPPVEPRELIPI